jgi:tellurite resistance protein
MIKLVSQMKRNRNMDTENFTQELDKLAYIEALIIIASVEDGITQPKKDFIKMQSDLLSIDIEPLLEKVSDISDFKSKSMSRTTKMSIIRDSISFAYIDGRYSQSEQESVYKIAEALAIDKSDVDAMENWLKEYWLILDKGNLLLGLK